MISIISVGYRSKQINRAASQSGELVLNYEHGSDLSD